jgi:folate-binding protein YgfZ
MSFQEGFFPQGYQAAISGSAFYLWENPGFLHIHGADQRTFLQRQTTNDLQGLNTSGCLVTVLTNPAARILDVLTLLVESDGLLVITLPGRGGSTFNYLRSRIFFNDKVTIDNTSQEMALIDLIGPESGSLFAQMGIGPAPVENTVVSTERDGGSLIGFVQHGLGYRLACQARHLPDLLATLEKKGTVQLSFDTYELLRIEAGVPAGGLELTDEYTPLEAGLGWAISAAKGCYTGQEVIARQITYDKVTRHLAGLNLDQATQVGEGIFSTDEDRQVGMITSAAVSPRLGPIALAILRRPYNEPGSQVAVGKNEGSLATVVSLPF